MINQENITNWHALYVKSRAEKKVFQSFEMKGIKAYLPLIKKVRVWSDRKKMIETPLFNGYVFVKNDFSENEIILRTNGVVNFVRSAGKIAVIRDLEIERLKHIVSLGYDIEASDSSANFKNGDKVKILAGPLKDIEGYVIENKDSKSIEILLESIGQSIRVKLKNELLLPLN